jgi:hypothetical protein
MAKAAVGIPKIITIAARPVIPSMVVLLPKLARTVTRALFAVSERYVGGAWKVPFEPTPMVENASKQ